MGSPKALLRYAGETFLDRLIGLFARECSPVVVVLGAHASTIRAQLQRTSEAQFVVNENWPAGQLTSLQCGLRALPADCGAVLYTLVDHPAVKPETVAALAAADGRELLCIPRCGDRRGHPIRISPALFAEFLEEPESAKQVVRRHVAETRYLDVDDPGILADIDDPAAYRDLLGARA